MTFYGFSNFFPVYSTDALLRMFHTARLHMIWRMSERDDLFGYSNVHSCYMYLREHEREKCKHKIFLDLNNADQTVVKINNINCGLHFQSTKKKLHDSRPDFM
jgi:hypothetical protein